MKVLNLAISLEGLTLGEEEKKMTNIELCTRIIGNVMYGYSTQVRGLTKVERNQFWRINSIFDGAVKNKTEMVSLEDTDFGFIRKCFRETKLNPSDLLERAEQAVDSVKVE
jgi:hypothetical protein